MQTISVVIVDIWANRYDEAGGFNLELHLFFWHFFCSVPLVTRCEGFFNRVFRVPITVSFISVSI
jgi:hypothetical protein